ncbi:T9SS type A sorting domain-containing protein [candidate division KSB1 bacterium]|nr:T9SS type A sorting domain-containing protein [candidate division KSB1 bacterium]
MQTNFEAQHRSKHTQMVTFIILSVALIVLPCTSFCETVSFSYHLTQPVIIHHSNGFQSVALNGCYPMGRLGQPVFPMRSVALVLPPGHAARSIQFRYSGLKQVTEPVNLIPQQAVRTNSSTSSGFYIDAECYRRYDPLKAPAGNVQTHFLHGFPVALSCFSPVEYVPAEKKLSYYESVDVIIETAPDEKALHAMRNFSASASVLKKLKAFVHNQSNLANLSTSPGASGDYEYLIITIDAFVDEYQELAEFYNQRGIRTRVCTVDEILASVTGTDSQEKIRNYIIVQSQTHQIEYVLLAGDADDFSTGELQVPVRGLYTLVYSGEDIYQSYNIPSDLYYSALDGNWNDDSDDAWGEEAEADLLPELAVGRITADNLTEVRNVITKIINYQSQPVVNDATRMVLLGEFMWSNPLTYGVDFLRLLIGNHDDNAYSTVGMSENLDFFTLFDKDASWNSKELLNLLRRGCNLVAHAGHASKSSVMKFSINQIVEEAFKEIDGVRHLNPILYSHGCEAAAIDWQTDKNRDSIGEEMVNIATFASAFIGNTRYGWFNEGQTEGPSLHLHREFISAMYGDSVCAIGAAHALSRIRSAPFVTAPDQWEPGALRWCFYGCNVLGDPAMCAWTQQIQEFSQVDFPNTITANTHEITVQTGVPGATITLSSDGAYLADARTGDAGVATIPIAFSRPITQIVLTLTKQNYLPLTGYIAVSTGIEQTETDAQPYQFALYPPYPNPFNSSLQIRFSITEKGPVSVAAYNALGQKIILADRVYFPAGVHSLEWDATDVIGNMLPSGVYYLRLTSNDGTRNRRVVLIR